MPTDEEAAIRDRLAKLAAEGRHAEREAVAWQLADYIMRGPVGFNPHRRRSSSERPGCAIRSSRQVDALLLHDGDSSLPLIPRGDGVHRIIANGMRTGGEALAAPDRPRHRLLADDGPRGFVMRAERHGSVGERPALRDNGADSTIEAG